MPVPRLTSAAPHRLLWSYVLILLVPAAAVAWLGLPGASRIYGISSSASMCAGRTVRK